MEKLNLPPFYVGQRLVCIDADNSSGILKKNHIYTCMGVADYDPDQIYIKEIAGIGRYLYRSAFASRFRPLQEQKFKAISFEKVMEETEQLCEN